MITVSHAQIPRVLPDERMPPEVVKALIPIVARLLPFVPSWVHELRLDWKDEDGGATAKCVVRHEYRWVRILVTGLWLEEPPADRAGVLLHEILHVHLNELNSLASTVIEQVTKDDKAMQEILFERLRETRESAICDLTAAMIAALYADPASVGEIAPSGE